MDVCLISLCTPAAIGVDAVSNAVLAIGNCRLYLEQDCKVSFSFIDHPLITLFI